MTDCKTGRPLPGLGATALQAGRYVGGAIKLLLDGKNPAPFEYSDKGTMAQIGRGAAAAQLPGGRTLTGHFAWLAWLGVHLILLNNADEKSSVFVEWGWNILTHNRGKRIILSDEDAASASATSAGARGVIFSAGTSGDRQSERGNELPTRRDRGIKGVV